jgi:holo-[acyl-carrier protein] synthase
MDIGVDIVEIDRIARSAKNPHFLARVFTPQEVKYCRSRKHSEQHFAVRFAAKEAVWKAISGRHGGLPLLHRDIQIRNQADGKPHVVFPPPFKKLERRVSISLSHGRDYAVAMAIYVKS